MNRDPIIRKTLDATVDEQVIEIRGGVYEKPLYEHEGRTVYSAILLVDKATNKLYSNPRNYGFRTEEELDTEMKYISENIELFKP